MFYKGLNPYACVRNSFVFNEVRIKSLATENYTEAPMCKLGKILKIRKNTPKAKFGKVPKYSVKSQKILVKLRKIPPENSGKYNKT